MQEVTCDPDRRNPWTGLKFKDDEIDRFMNRFDEHLSNRRSVLVANTWRVRGLVKSIRSALKQEGAKQRFTVEVVQSIEGCLDWIEREHSEENSQNFSASILGYNKEEMIKFLRTMGKNRLSYSTRLPVKVGEMEIGPITKALGSMGIKDVRPLAMGGEGIIFTDGRKAFKYFYAGKAHFEGDQLEFIKEAMSPSKVPLRFVPLEQVIEKDGNLVFRMPLIEGTDYKGGHLSEIIELLRACREKGMAMKNIAPDNFRVGADGLCFTDLGRDIRPFSEGLYREMCKRAYLCYRWHFRPDLKEVMRRSLHDESLPELYGLDNFLEAIEDGNGRAQLEESVRPMMERYRGKEIMDYGCREGVLSNVMARTASKVWCFDIDMSRFGMIEHDGNVGSISRRELDDRIAVGPKFDVESAPASYARWGMKKSTSF